MSAEAWSATAAVGALVFSFVGGSLGARIAARADNRLERRWRREETGRTIRWAAEKAVDPDPSVRAIGFAALDALAGAELLQAEDRHFVRRVALAALSNRLVPTPPEGDTGSDGE